MSTKKSVPTPEIIRKLREKHDLKQESVAKHLGVVQQTYSNYEKGVSAISLYYLSKLADLYEVSADYLLGRSTFEKSVDDMDKLYAQGKTFGEVTSAMLSLSPDRRRQMMDYLSYLVVREKEDHLKQKPMEQDPLAEEPSADDDEAAQTAAE